MAKHQREKEESPMPRPAMTPEGREAQMINLAYDLAEQRLRDGTASAQETTAFLRLGSSRERLEQEKMRLDQKVAMAKIEAMESQTRIEEMYRSALSAMSAYQGRDPEEIDEFYED